MKKETQLTNDIKKLQYQLSYSEHINKEMAHYLSLLYEKTGLSPNKFKQVGDICLINNNNHLQQLYYVEPLIMCYEENIHLLKTELDEMKEDASTIKSHSEQIVKENEFLRRELQVKIKHIMKCEQLGINVNFLKLDNEDLKQKLKLVQQIQTNLIHKNKQLNQIIENQNKVKRQLYDETYVQSAIYKAKQQARLLQKENIDLKNKFDIMRNKLQNEQSINANLQQKILTLQSQLMKTKNDTKVVKQQLQNTQTVQQGVQSNLQGEVESLKEQLRISHRKEQQLFNSNMQLETQISDNKSKCHNLNVQNSQLQTNNNNMLQMLQTYQVKVNTMGKKIKKLQSQTKQNNSQSSQHIKQIQILQWKLSEKQEQVQRKEGEWRKQKSRINKMWEDRIQTVKKTVTSN